MKREELIKAAQELNEVLGLEPQIDTSVDDNKLKELLIEAAGLIEPGDDLTLRTIRVLRRLEKEMGGTADIATTEETSPPEEPTPAPTPTPRALATRAKIDAELKKGKLTMTQVMDMVLSEGGTWTEMASIVRDYAVMLGYEPKKYPPSVLRAHAKSRLEKGKLNIRITEAGVEKGE